ncbi:MAG: TetR/AcrR family transcriptional regulator [Clostridia bacterium]|nr:TetR/AcrR family transcriptional regulator [Clostridia bacterium]
MLHKKGIERRNKMIHAAVVLFLENGYEKTTTAHIAKAAGFSATSFFAAFSTKEELLLTLVKFMFSGQFLGAEQLSAFSDDPLILYGIETGIQINIIEISEALREIYVAAYSLPSTSDYIYATMADKIENIFGRYVPGGEKKDFYELEIASGSIMRGFMAKPCDIYFTVENKIKRFLDCSMRIYGVPDEKRQEVINAVLLLDLNAAAENIISTAIATAERGFE